MKQILIAIDFSKTSITALEYGIRLANEAEADVLMVWVDNAAGDEAVYDGFPNENRNEKIGLFKELQSKYSDKLKKGKISYKTRRGKVYTEVANLARTTRTDLVIAGTHGVSGFEEFWIGSNAYRIVTNAPCPVVTLRGDYKQGDIKKIVIPIDSSQETRQKIPVASEIALLFGAEMHLLSLYSTNLKTVRKRVDNYADQVIKYLDEKGISSKLEARETDNITRTTIEYAESVNADLIAIMTEQETTTANIFLGPYAQQMVNHSPVPVLSLRSTELEQIPI